MLERARVVEGFVQIMLGVTFFNLRKGTSDLQKCMENVLLSSVSLEGFGGTLAIFEYLRLPSVVFEISSDIFVVICTGATLKPCTALSQSELSNFNFSS